MTRLLALSLAALLVVDAARGQVFDVSPTGPISQIQQAITLAPAGSTIRVASGSYAPFNLGLGLTILARVGAQVVVVGQSSIGGVPAGQTAAVCGITLRSREWLQNQTDNHALVVGPSAGSVLLRACTIQTGTVTWRGSGIPAPTSALLANDCRLLLDSVTCQGTSGTHGALISFASAGAGYVAIAGGSFRGGDSDCGPFCFPDSAPAGHGAVIAQAPALYAANASFRGGDVVNMTQTSTGGIGLALPASQALLRACNVRGGTSGIHAGNVGGFGILTTATTTVGHDGTSFLGGAAGGGSGAAGLPGTGPVAPQPHRLASVSLSPVFFDLGLLAAVTVHGHPAEPHVAFLGLRLIPNLIPLAGISEPLLLDAAGLLVAFASLVTDGTGNATVGFTVPNDPTLIGRPLFFQDVGVDLSVSRVFLSAPAGTVLR